MLIQTQSCEWKQLPRNMNNQLHTICSYMAMFPPSVPHYFIDNYSHEDDVVLDPFCGRGTTVLEACLMNRNAIGNDKNPLAYVLTKAKADVPLKSNIISRLNHLEKLCDPSEINVSNVHSNIKMLFQYETLCQLEYLKNRLQWKTSNVDSFITAMILGILHGNSEGYLSVSMPNTFSMSPNYVRKYIKEHKLIKPDRDVFFNLRKKIERCYQRPEKIGKTYCLDARNMHHITDSSVNLIITSPPYTRVIRYGQFNWIRLWFLDKTGKDVDQDLFFTESIDRYSSFMKDVLFEMRRVLTKKGKAILIIGDVEHRIKEETYNLAQIIWERCAQPLGFTLAEPIIEDIVSEDSKVSKIWGEKKGKATKIDRVLILKK